MGYIHGVNDNTVQSWISSLKSTYRCPAAQNGSTVRNQLPYKGEKVQPTTASDNLQFQNLKVILKL